MTEIHAFFHIYADGQWGDPVRDYFHALLNYGLYEQLTSLNIGFVGCRDNIERVKTYLRTLPITFNIVAESQFGWEQETIIPMWEFSKTHEGLLTYAHSKGAAFQKDISQPWRRSMLYYNIVNWRTPVDLLLKDGKKIAGCHWIAAAPSITNESWGFSGMFGGTFWWTKCEVLRENVSPTLRSRLDAEHWIGQLSEVMDLSSHYIADLNPRPIADFNSHATPEWIH